jgi:hypothetical protein
MTEPGTDKCPDPPRPKVAQEENPPEDQYDPNPNLGPGTEKPTGNGHVPNPDRPKKS